MDFGKKSFCGGLSRENPTPYTYLLNRGTHNSSAMNAYPKREDCSPAREEKQQLVHPSKRKHAENGQADGIRACNTEDERIHLVEDKGTDRDEKPVDRNPSPQDLTTCIDSFSQRQQRLKRKILGTLRKARKRRPAAPKTNGCATKMKKALQVSRAERNESVQALDASCRQSHVVAYLSPLVLHRETLHVVATCARQSTCRGVPSLLPWIFHSAPR